MSTKSHHRGFSCHTSPSRGERLSRGCIAFRLSVDHGNRWRRVPQRKGKAEKKCRKPSRNPCNLPDRQNALHDSGSNSSDECIVLPPKEDQHQFRSSVKKIKQQGRTHSRICQSFTHAFFTCLRVCSPGKPVISLFGPSAHGAGGVPSRVASGRYDAGGSVGA